MRQRRRRSGGDDVKKVMNDDDGNDGRSGGAVLPFKCLLSPSELSRWRPLDFGINGASARDSCVCII